MPVDWKALLKPGETAVLVIECQEGVIGESSLLKGLVQAVQDGGLVPRLARFLGFARSAGVPVFHCTVEKRADGLGDAFNTPLTASLRGRRSPMSPGSKVAAIIKGLEPDPTDHLVPRASGMTAFHDCGLDSILRSLGVKTVVPTGVSVNIAITGATIDAVNRGMRVAIPTDCVAGTPPEYAQAVLQNTLRNLAYLTTAEEMVSAWGLNWNGGR